MLSAFWQFTFVRIGRSMLHISLAAEIDMPSLLQKRLVDVPISSDGVVTDVQAHIPAITKLVPPRKYAPSKPQDENLRPLNHSCGRHKRMNEETTDVIRVQSN
jgi:hypothetical protein